MIGIGKNRLPVVEVEHNGKWITNSAYLKIVDNEKKKKEAEGRVPN